MPNWTDDEGRSHFMEDEKKKPKIEKLHAAADQMAQFYFDDMLENLRSNPALLRLTRYYFIQKVLKVLNKQPNPIGEVQSGHDIISWMLGQCQIYRREQPKPLKVEHRFEG